MAKETESEVVDRTSARQGREGKPVLMVLVVSTLAIIVVMGILMVMAGSNDTPEGIGVVEETGGTATEAQEQPTADAPAEPMETPTSAQ